MSYRQDDQYSRPVPPPPPPPRPAHEQQPQHYYPPDQYVQGQNGGYHVQHNQSYSGYPPQPQYAQSASQYGYVAPTYSTGHTVPHYQQSPATSYNPQQYSPQPVAGSIPAYNPQTYASPHGTPYPTQYNPAAYPSDPHAQATSGPLDDPYAYNYAASSQPSYAATQSPHQSFYTPLNSHSNYNSPAQPHSAYPQSSYHDQHQSNHQSQPAYSPRVDSQPSPALPGAIDESWRPSPPAHQNSDPRYNNDTLHHTLSFVSLPSPPSESPGPTPPVHSHNPGRTTSLRHPQSRPLPVHPPMESTPEYFNTESQGDMTRAEAEAMSQEELWGQVEHAVMTAGRNDDEDNISIPNTGLGVSGAHLSHLNGHQPPVAQHGHYTDESDTEAIAGLEAMRIDDMREAQEEQRRRSSVATRLSGTVAGRRNSRQAASPGARPDGSDSDDFGTVDMTAFGGGFHVGMSNAADPNQLSVGVSHSADGHPTSSQHSSVRRSHASQSSRGEHAYTPASRPDSAPYINPHARVDAGGTGGNYVPTADGRRQSFDEGDDTTFTDNALPDRYPDEPPDIFYHPSAAAPGYRPLPPPPPQAASQFPDAWIPTLHTDLQPPPPYAPDEYTVDAEGLHVPRSTSLTTHTTTPLVSTPLRSKTDAEERKKLGYRSSGYNTAFDTPSESTAVPLDLPSLAAKRFIPSKLGAPDFNRCEEPWALSALLLWLIDVTTPDQTTELKESAVKDALVNLFTNKVPTMNIADAEVLSDRVVQDMYNAGALQVTEEWVKLVHIEMSGVIFQLTGTGCYSPTLHDHIVPGRCYAHYCQRTLKKVDLLTHPVRMTETWAEFYKLKKEDVETKDRKEIERQNVLHEVVQTEDIYMEQLNILQTLYRDPLDASDPSIITPKRKEKFIRDVFGRLDAVRQANEDHLLPQLKYRQQEQGPWIVGFSDIFRQWIRKAKAAYIDYAGAFPGATFTVRQELERNMQFQHFLDRARVDSRSHKLGWDTYLKAPITRLQRYTLLLQTVLKNMKTDSEEKTNLEIACEEVRSVTRECDTRVAEMQRKVDLADLATKLVLRPGMQSAVELNLNHLGRELIHRGDLQRMGGNRFTWLDSHAILFDHYLVLAKTVTQRADQGERFDKYDVSRLPIPMDLLTLETTNESAVQKSSYMKGITTVTTVTGSQSTQLTKTSSSQSVPLLQQANANTALQRQRTDDSGLTVGKPLSRPTSSVQSVTTLNDSKETDNILYPFRIRHLGREAYTLFAYSEQARRDWCNKILEAKTKHAAALYAQHAEPFRLRVMADSAFVYDGFPSTGGKGVLIKGTPVDRALREVAHRFKDTGRPAPICRARVNCATTFTTPYPGKQMVAVGTDYGVFVSEKDNPRGWTKAITIGRVTQVAVLEDFSLFLLIAEKSLIAYHLDIICPGEQNGPSTANDSARKAPQKLSGSKDVGFFVTGKMKDRTLLFYKKRENLSSTFKVLEPVYQKSTEKKRGMFRRGTTEFFREYDEFYIPAECAGINLFHSSLAVSTARGFEVLTLDRKQPVSVPDLKPEHVQNIERHLKDQRALCMLRISDQEFLLCYANCAVYINKHGDVSRSVIMEFVGTAQAVAMYGAYIILFDNDFVEIRNAQNGRLKQIISGREIKCLDDGACWTSGGNNNITNPSATNGISTPIVGFSPTAKFVMQHPEVEKTQIIVELLLNEDMKE